MIEVTTKNPVPCPTCGGETARHFDNNLKPTGKRICLFPLTCPQGAFYHIPTAQEIEAVAVRSTRDAQLDLEGGAL